MSARRGRRISGVAAALLIVALAAPASPQPGGDRDADRASRAGREILVDTSSALYSVSSVEQFYTLTATTQSGLVAQIAVLGPKDSAGAHWGYTRATWRWATRYATNAGRCSVAKVIVDLDIVTTLPRWDPPVGSAPDTMTWWNGALRTLLRHEDGHKDISLRVAREILNGISRLPSESSCDAMNEAARAVNERWDAEHRRLHLEYDARTQHGRAQP